MSWSAPATRATGDLITASIWNTDIVGNLLDLHQEGAFTPVLKFGGATTGISYSRQAGVYKRVGNVVFCTVDVILTSKGSGSGSAQLFGLPFTASSSPCFASSVFAYGGGASLTTSPVALVVPSSAQANLQYLNGSDLVDLNDTNFNNNTEITIGFTYFV